MQHQYVGKGQIILVNIIWLILLLAGILVAGINGRIEVVTEAAFHAAKTGVEISIEIIGIMTLWLGLLKLAENPVWSNFWLNLSVP